MYICLTSCVSPISSLLYIAFAAQKWKYNTHKTSHYDLLTLYLIAPKSGHTSFGLAHIDCFRDASLTTKFCPQRRSTMTCKTVDWRISHQISSLPFHTKMSWRWLILSHKLKGFYQCDSLAINIELKRNDENFACSSLQRIWSLIFFVI